MMDADKSMMAATGHLEDKVADLLCDEVLNVGQRMQDEGFDIECARALSCGALQRATLHHLVKATVVLIRVSSEMGAYDFGGDLSDEGWRQTANDLQRRIIAAIDKWAREQSHKLENDHRRN